MSDNKKYCSMIRFTVVVVVLIIIIILFLITVSLLSKKSERNPEDDFSNWYHSTHLTIGSNNSKVFGIISLPEKIIPRSSTIQKSFIFSSVENGENYHLISTFGDNEYQCTGICYCSSSSSEERRISSFPLAQKGIIYALAAVSSILAIQLAQEYFSEECEGQLSQICDYESSTITSEVEDCKEIDTAISSSDESGKEMGANTFVCSGVCKRRVFHDPEKIKIAEYFGCERMRNLEEINARSNPNYLEKTSRNWEQEQEAKKVFLQEHMRPFCEGFFDSSLGVEQNLCCVNEPSIRCRLLDGDDSEEKKGRDKWVPEKKNTYEDGRKVDLDNEIFDTLYEKKNPSNVQIEKIISQGQVTPEGEWYDQEQDEFVMVMKGEATLLFQNSVDGKEEEFFEMDLGEGDYVMIPKHVKHRVIRTSLNTFWMAVHIFE